MSTIRSAGCSSASVSRACPPRRCSPNRPSPCKKTSPEARSPPAPEAARSNDTIFGLDSGGHGGVRPGASTNYIRRMSAFSSKQPANLGRHAGCRWKIQVFNSKTRGRSRALKTERVRLAVAGWPSTPPRVIDPHGSDSSRFNPARPQPPEREDLGKRVRWTWFW